MPTLRIATRSGNQVSSIEGITMESQCVLTFAGHMIDRQDRPSPRFPLSAESLVRSKIQKAIKRLSPIAAVSSAASGGDIIFAESILEQNIPLYIILPFEDKKDFLQLSVAYAGVDWEERFQKVCDHATIQPYFANGGEYENDKDFEDNQRAMLFFALGFAASRNIWTMCLALYDDGQPGDSIGGTRGFIELCRSMKIPYEVIDMKALRSEAQQSENRRRRRRK